MVVFVVVFVVVVAVIVVVVIVVAVCGVILIIVDVKNMIVTVGTLNWRPARISIPESPYKLVCSLGWFVIFLIC